MAGESPDRSKQRESSADPTSGSAGPVPEARTESPEPSEKRDPRLAMARRSAGASPKARGGVDTATRVFSVREPAAEAEGAAQDAVEAPQDVGAAHVDAGKPDTDEAGRRATEPETAEEAAQDAVEPQDGGTGDGGDGQAGKGDQDPVQPRADAEVGAAEAEAGQDDAKSPDGDTSRDARGAETDGQAAKDAGKAKAAAGKRAQEGTRSSAEQPTVRGTAAPETHVGEAGDAEDAGQEAEEPEAGATDAHAESADAEGPTAEAASGTASGPASGTAGGTTGDARLRDAGADRAASADDEADAGDVQGAAAAEDIARAGGRETDADAADQASYAGTDADGPASERADHRADTDAPAPKADSDPDADSDAGTSDATDESDSDTEAEAAEPDDEPASDAKAESTTGTVESAPQAAPEPAPDPDPGSGSGSGSASEPDPSDGPAAGADGDTEADADADQADESPGDAERPVDQPTAVFKAVRPPAPPVDQPTTMLKLGDAAKARRDEPESPAERTSRFVALKPLDDPATRRPKPADATAAPPQVTQAPKEPQARPPADATSPVPRFTPERTTQQPLPPKPPLDLLAELTNTPPPPATPVRTVVRRVKIWTPLVLLLAVVFAIVQAVRPLPAPVLTLTADNSYTFKGSGADLPWPSEGQGWMDVNGIGTMGDFGKQRPVPIGSIAKAMTAYVVLKDHPLKSGAQGPSITVDATAAKEGGYDAEGESTLNTVKEGDKLTLRQALSAIMIPSANNIARLLARWDAGTEAAFIKKMNAAAKDLGMKNTTYTDASGLTATTVSTAEDQVKLGNQLVKMPALMEITSMGQWIDPSGHKWYNYNYLVPYNGAIGIKTGTTTAAGGNLLFAARKKVGGENVTLVGAILSQYKGRSIIETVNDVSKTAMLAAQGELTSAKIMKKGDVVGYVDDGLGGRTPVVVTEDVTAVGWAGLKVKLSFASDEVPHSAKAGTKVGTLTVGDGASGAVKVPVALEQDLVEPGYPEKLTRLG